MIFWLVLIVAGQVASNETPHSLRIMHVGNYSSYAACEKYAAGYTTPVKPSNNPPQITLLCIQANEPGRTQPPPGWFISATSAGYLPIVRQTPAP
jgi:hypothetical protein